MPALKQQFYDLIDEISAHQEGLLPQRKQEFQELAPLLAWILKAHNDLEGKAVLSDALEFEAYQRDEETCKIHKSMDNVNETLQKSDDQLVELQEQMTGFENSIAELTKEIESLTL